MLQIKESWSHKMLQEKTLKLQASRLTDFQWQKEVTISDLCVLFS